MLKIESIQNGIVIDHIPAGKGMDIYKLLELDSQKPALCKHGASLLYEKANILLKLLLDDDESLAEHGSALCTSDVKGVAQLRQVRELQIAFGSRQRHGETGSVDISHETMLKTFFTESLKLAFCIYEACFG